MKLRDGMSATHLANIRKLPSCVSGKRGCEAHHLCGGPAATERGVSRKASDRWAVPLTHEEHMDLHTFGSRLEREWFANRGIVDVYGLADALWNARGLPERLERIVLKAVVGM